MLNETEKNTFDDDTSAIETAPYMNSFLSERLHPWTLDVMKLINEEYR